MQRPQKGAMDGFSSTVLIKCTFCLYPHSLTCTPPEWLQKTTHHTKAQENITSISFHFFMFFHFLHFSSFCCCSCFNYFFFLPKIMSSSVHVCLSFSFSLSFVCLLDSCFPFDLIQNRYKNVPPLPMRWQEPYFNLNLNLDSISSIVLHFLFRYISLF